MSGAADRRIGGSADRRISGSADQRVSEPANYELRITNYKLRISRFTLYVSRLTSKIQNPRSKTQNLASLLFLAAAALLFFWPVWVMNYRFPVGGGDLWGQLHPVWNYVAAWVRRGVFPLWSTQMMAGDPIISEQQYGLLNPLNWPLFLFSPISPLLISLRSIFSVWFAGAGLYLYLHRSPVWKLPQAAALTSALAYMFCDSFVVHLGHPQFNDTMAWLPWCLLGIDYAMRRRRAIPWAGAAIGCLFLAGHGQAALYAGVWIVLYSLWQCAEGLRFSRSPVPEDLTRRRRDAKKERFPHIFSVSSVTSVALKRAGRLALVALIGACVAAPALLPGLERLPYTERAAVQQSSVPEYEFPSAMLVDFLSPAFHGRSFKSFWPVWDRVESGYVGAVSLALAGLGLICRLRRRSTWFLIAMGAGVYLFALGSHGPIYPWLSALPFFKATWKTARIIYLLSFCLAIAGGLGVEVLMRARRTQGLRHSLWIWGGLLLLAAGSLWLRAPVWTAAISRLEAQLPALTGLRFAAFLWGVTALLGWAARRGWARAALVALLVMEMAATGALADVEKLPQAGDDPHAAAIAYLKSDPGWFRVDVDGNARGLWSPAAIMAAGFEVPQGTGNPMELVAYTQFYWAVPFKGAPVYQLIGAKYIAVSKGALPGGAGIWPAFDDDPLIDLHLNTNAMNRVWLVYHTRPVQTLEEAYGVIFAPDFQPTHTVTLLNGPLLESQGQGTLEVLAYGPNRVSIHVTTSEPAIVTFSDLLYPGWKATLNGQAVPIYTANGLFRGVLIPAGSHLMEMRFFPVSLRLGLGFLGMALLGIAAGSWVQKRKRWQIG
ncbi:MAG: YfhO family protein [Anaerolineae bacterium]|nr:YfhO family protein [Anaerolineae bacterium]